MSPTEERNLDKRIVERSLRRGALSKDAYARYIEELADASENATFIAYGEDELPDEPA